MRYALSAASLCFSLFAALAGAQEPAKPAPAARDTVRGDQLVAEYFRRETSQLAANCLSEIKSAEDWNAKKETYRGQLREMLGLEPMPPRTDLKLVVTGKHEHEDYRVENLHFQSSPGLYVTGNLYLPKVVEGKLPTILYVCGHARVKKDGISYGNKSHYQHHGIWFARHGFVCLVIDTIQLGEIEGYHHGTYGIRNADGWNQWWWWPARGYSPAGVEAWNSIRALDYLETRPEVDPKRFGVTGRSGGGAYSWWLAAIDERIQAAVPVAGITDLQNYVVDGVIEGHCDCMFPVNTYRWDLPMVSALVAPRALLIANTDKDPIFPLEGVVHVYRDTRRIYKLLGAEKKLGLLITEGPHEDTQDLQVPTFHWFQRHLQASDPPIRVPAQAELPVETLKVFEKNPADEIVSRIHETFVPLAKKPSLPENAEQWAAQRDGWLQALREKTFRGWPDETRSEPPAVREVFRMQRDGVDFSAYDFVSQEPYTLRLYLQHRAELPRKELELVVLNVLDEPGWQSFVSMSRFGFADQFRDEPPGEPAPAEFKSQQGMFKSFKWGMAYLAPRGIGPTAWDARERKQTQNRRRFYLLGQSWEGMQVWDARRSVQALRSVPELGDRPLWLQGERQMAGVALYTGLFEPNIKRVDLHALPTSHREGPYFLNVLKIWDVPQAVAVAAEKSQVRLYHETPASWDYAKQVSERLGWNARQLQVRPVAGRPPANEAAPAQGTAPAKKE